METQALVTTIEKAIPVLPSLDFGRSIGFYEQKLGFKLGFRYNERVGLERDGFELHFWPCEDASVPPVSSCYVIVKNIEALYEEYKAQGVIHPNGALESKPWGMKQFAILDPDGNMIQFGERV